MKKIVMMFAVMLCALSANAKAYGVFCFLDNAEKHVYEDDNIQLVIGTGEDRKTPILFVVNKTDQVVYIDKENSFAYLNDRPENLFSNSAQTSSQLSSTGASVNLGSIAGAVGVGGAVGSLLNGVNVGSSGGTTSGSIVYEKRVLSIAPKSAIAIYSWTLNKSLIGYKKNGQELIYEKLSGGTSRFRNSGGSMEKFKKGLSRHYDANNSPCRLKGIVKYSTKEDFSDSKLVNTDNFLKDIVIDSTKGVKKGYDFALNITPYLLQPCFSFSSGRLSAGDITAITFGSIAVVAGLATLIGANQF